MVGKSEWGEEECRVLLALTPDSLKVEEMHWGTRLAPVLPLCNFLPAHDHQWGSVGCFRVEQGSVYPKAVHAVQTGSY